MLDTGITTSVMRLSRPPPLRNLRAFCVAARHRSFKFAADELFLTPSAVSHQMKELEDSLGVRLFERKTRALALTTARSEERRVGKECRSRWSRYHQKKKATRIRLRRER